MKFWQRHKKVRGIIVEDAEPEPIYMEFCPECDGGFVHPVTWREVDDDKWEIECLCPECFWNETGVYLHEDVERFDDVLNRGTDMLIEACEQLSRENMSDYVKSFSYCLAVNAILPEDF